MSLNIENLNSPASLVENSIGFQTLPAGYTTQTNQTFPVAQTFANIYTLTGTIHVNLTNVMLTPPQGVATALTSANASSLGELSTNGANVNIAYSTSAAGNPALPSILTGGVVPVYSKSTTIQPGSWSSIYGSNLANGTTLWNGNFPTSLGGTSVTVDSKLAYLWFVSSGQINFQAPDDTATGPVPVVVSTAAGTATSTVTLAQVAPSFLVLADGVHVTAIVLTPGSPGNSGAGYDVIGPTRPVKAGETLVVYGVGFGPTKTAVAAGSVYASATSTTNTVSVAIGGVAVPQADVTFSGLVGAGLYQLNIVVPSNPGTGDKAIVAAVGGAQTQSGVLLSLQ